MSALTTLKRPQEINIASETRTQLDALTFLRFIGAAAVVLQHSIFTFQLPRSIELWNMTAALSFFFVLSGFILSYAHPRFDKKSDYLRFFRARVARCWPLHMATFLIFAFLVKDGAGYDAAGNPRLDVCLAQIFFVQAWSPDPSFFFSFNTPARSISVEYFFYLCFPFIQLWRHTHGLIKSALLVAAAAAIAAGCNSIAMHSTIATFKTWVFYINPLSHLFEFTIGIFCSALFLHWRKFNNRTVATTAQIAAIILGVLFFAHLNEICHVMPWFPVQVQYGLYCAVLVLAFSLSSGLPARLVSNKVLVKLGDMSYAIYLLHSVISHAFHPQWEHLAQTKGIIAFVIYVFCVLVASYLCHEYFESPMRQLFLGKKKSFS